MFGFLSFFRSYTNLIYHWMETSIIVYIYKLLILEKHASLFQDLSYIVTLSLEISEFPNLAFQMMYLLP